MVRIGQLSRMLMAMAMVISSGIPVNAKDLAYLNYWDLTSSRSPVELHLDKQAVTRKYRPDRITASQAVPAGQRSIWLNKPRQRLATVRMEAGQFYTVVLLKQKSTVKGVVLNNKVAPKTPTLRLVNLTTEKVRVIIQTNTPLEIKPGEQQDIPVSIKNASAVGLVTVKATSVKIASPTVKTFGVGPDYASVLLIDQPGPTLRLTRWQYDQCAVRIQKFNYADACGHSD